MQKPSGNIKNSTWNLANILLYPIAFLAITPLFINKLGEDSFGIWMLVNSYVYIAVNIISFGLGNSIIAHVAEALGKGNSHKLHAYINSSTKLIGWISIGTIVIALLATTITYFGIEVFKDNLDKILIVATLLISVKFWELLYQSILKGFERYDLASVYSIFSKLVVLAAQVVIVILGYSIWEIFVSNLIINILMFVVQAFIAYRLMPNYKFSRHTSVKERNELFHFGFWTWLQTIISVLAYQLDRFVIAIFLGPAIAGYYILASTISNHMHMAFGAIVSWLFPKVARKKESEQNVTIYFQTLRGFSVGISLLAIFVTFLLYEPLFTLWLGPDKFQKMESYFRLFLIFETFLVMTIVPLFYLNGLKMLRFITSLEFMYKIGIIVGMLIAFWIVPTAESLIIGQIVALAILVPLEYLLIDRKLLKDNWIKETIITMIPSFLISAIIIFDKGWLTIGLGFLSLLIFYSYFLNKKRFHIKLLLE